ncbi:MAG: adenosine kinase [Zavarzinella sp.]
MKKEFALCGVGHAIVDIFVEVGEDDFSTMGFERGTMRMVEKADQLQLLDRFQKSEPRLVSGGSVGNSTIAFAQLGGKAAFISCVGDDRYGLHYEREFEQLKIEMGNPVIVGETTGTCICVITPDAERTMRTFLGVSSHLAPRHVQHDRNLIEASEWVFIEGYMFANVPSGQEAIVEILKIAKQAGTKVAVTCSDGFIPEVFTEPFFNALQHTDLLFCNAAEAMSITKTETAQEAFASLVDRVPNSVVTDGPNGAFIRYNHQESHVPAYSCTPRDLTGAGDMFAGAFLYGISSGMPAPQAAKGANFLAMKVISQVGARLHHGAEEFFTVSKQG